MPLKLLGDWALFLKNNPSLNWSLYQECVDEFGMLRFAQAMTRLSVRLLGADAPFDLPVDEEADSLLEECIWGLPSSSASGGKSLFKRRRGIISNLMHARKRYKAFYDNSSLQMIVAYLRGYLFGG